eukprot:6343810-Prymnesium_polylepis.1
MVERGAAIRLVEHTRFVQLKGVLVRLDCHGHRLLRDSREHIVLIVAPRPQGRPVSDRHVRAQRDDGFVALARVARAGGAAARVVRVRGLRCDTIAFDPVERVVRLAAAAAEVGRDRPQIRALHEVLLRHGQQRTRRNEVGALDGTRGRKRPAGAALPLCEQEIERAMTFALRVVC